MGNKEINNSKFFPCHCCGVLTITELGNYEICNVCHWEDDPNQSSDSDYSGGANELSLNEYRKKYREQKEI